MHSLHVLIIVVATEGVVPTMYVHASMVGMEGQLTVHDVRIDMDYILLQV